MFERNFTNANNPVFVCDPDVVIVPFGRESYVRAIVDRCDGEAMTLDESTDRLAFRLPGAAHSVTLIYSGMGAPAMANALEMAAAYGAQRVVVFGACGGVVPEVGVGDLIVPTAAVRGEGTSRYYAPPPFPAVFDNALTAALRTAADAKLAGKTHSGVVYTTDAGYRQGAEIYEDHAGLVIAVENECSAAAVVGSRLGLRMGALLFCSDNVTLDTADDRGYRGLARPEVRHAFDVGVDVLLELLGP